jgi:hypothetical protein
MSEPSFLTVAQVERLHEKLINRFGGSPGLRDRVLFESAVIQPRNVYYYGQGDLFDIAAAYAFHISEAQAFLDGNKRTGMAATNDRNEPASDFCVRPCERRGIFLSNRLDTNELQRACLEEECRLTQFMVAGSFRSLLAGLK